MKGGERSGIRLADSSSRASFSELSDWNEKWRMLDPSTSPSATYPKAGESLEAAALVWPKAPVR